MTAGRDSIRIYRLKNGQLRGTSVRLVPTDKRVSTKRRTVSNWAYSSLLQPSGINDGALSAKSEMQPPCFRPHFQVTSHAGGVSAALGPNIFTDIAFEAGVGVYGVDAFKVRNPPSRHVSAPVPAARTQYYTVQLHCRLPVHQLIAPGAE